MARKEALRELQTRLAERLLAARTQDRQRAWLAVECAGQGFLLPLQQAGEIFGVVPLIGVPHTRPWFLGVANLRGGLYGVVDLARFLGLPALRADVPVRDPARLVVLNPRLELNCALRVERLAGLRRADQLSAEPPGDRPRPAFAATRYRDTTGRRWQELDLAALAADAAFVGIVN